MFGVARANDDQTWDSGAPLFRQTDFMQSNLQKNADL